MIYLFANPPPRVSAAPRVELAKEAKVRQDYFEQQALVDKARAESLVKDPTRQAPPSLHPSPKGALAVRAA